MISQTAEYALRAVVFLAQSDQVPINRKEISAATQIPNPYLHKVLQELHQAGIVSVQRGPGGGYQLIIDPNDLTVFDVVAAVDPIQRIERCPLGLKGHMNLCPLHRKLDDAAAQVETAFRETTIGSLIARRRSAKSCDFPGGQGAS